MGTFTRGDTAAMPPVTVSRESHDEDGVRITIEWLCNTEIRATVVDLTAADLRECTLSRTQQLDDEWVVKLFQHPRAGRRAVLASQSSRDRSAFRGLTIVDRDRELVAIDVRDGSAPRLVEGLPTLRPFRSDLTPLRGRRLRVLSESPTDDTGKLQSHLAGVPDVIADADTVGPGLTVRVRLPQQTNAFGYVAWDQLAFYDEPITTD